MPIPLLRIPCALLVLATSPAQAAWPDDVTISGMTEQGGVVIVDQAVLAEDYRQVIRELGTVVATGPLLPAHTLGARGFEATFDFSSSFTDTSGNSDTPDPWDRVQLNEDASVATSTPGISLRKGLPLSFEIGLAGKWIASSRQGILSGFVRAALIEGYKPLPDVNLHLGYAGYIGNNELDLGTFDVGLTIGSVFAVGPGRGAKDTRVSPYADVSLLVVSAVPKVDPVSRAAIGAVAFGKRDTDELPENNVKSITIPQFSGGFQVEAGRVVVRISGGYALKSVANAGVSLGVMY